MTEGVVLSHFQAQVLEDAWERGSGSADVSLDLGLTTVQVSMDPQGILFPDGQTLSWECIHEVTQSDSVCFSVQDNEIGKIQLFSDYQNRVYSLMPTQGAPTMLISGILMHRIKGIDPHKDTLKKLRTISPIQGRVLDICTGLGYTSIEAARTAQEVITIELDPTALEIARQNPWSQALFDNPRIQQIVGDAFDEVEYLEDGQFSRIIHDPPMFSLAGDLYSGEFYRHLFRVLGRKGRLFHYIGDLNSRSGRNVAKGVVRRLQEAGFARVLRRPGAFGVIALKK